MRVANEHLSPALTERQKIGQALLTAARALATAAEVILGKDEAAGEGLSLESLKNPDCLVTVIELINEFLLAKARAGRSDRYLRQLRVSLKNFSGGRGRAGIETVTAADLEKWIHCQDWAPRTQRGYLADVRTLFNFAVRRGYLNRNPAAAVELPVLDAGRPIELHTPDQVRHVLDTARRANLDVCRLLAVRYFAGLRSAEAHRIREEDLRLNQDLIEVPAVKAKTRARRLVTIQPNLKAWLQLGGELRPLSPWTVRQVIMLSKIDWPYNVTRRCFISNHIARWNSAGNAALEAGTSEAMIFAHYRGLVAPAAAAEYWEIRPG